ncbi:hypothetical protein GCM10007939_15240 [Amylibacter marinus]|uniref:Activator of Hsp90 ATPase homologue 1/2-like C-terminal domain-containing protein n=1 Tax=Amylibacter marinus TaxID=1475483 RepID=A0ABQ5VVJ0_9RHOB|nr:SRPBCC domain-containing protein [Amylibacter marinus]GLQ35241.1 hypothetical protein GCM10007939_15240 [Amylibacter marinus]
MSTSDLIKTIYLPVSPKVAWAYLTEPEKMAKWLHAPKEALRKGEDYALYGNESGDKLCWGRVTEMTPHTSLAYSFSVKPAPDLETHVYWTLDAANDGTLITLRHTGLAPSNNFDLLMGLDRGWDEHFASLRDAL